MRVLGFSGSLRADSHNSRLLRVAANSLPPETEFELVTTLDSLPAYNEDHEGNSAVIGPVAELREQVTAADAILIATPEYNSSIPGHLKNALDWLSRPFPDNALRGKPVAVIGASSGSFGAVWSQAETRKVLGAIGARVVGSELPVGKAADAFVGDERLHQEELHQQLEALLAELVEQTKIREQAAA